MLAPPARRTEGLAMKVLICGCLLATMGMTGITRADEFRVTEQSIFSFYQSLELLTPDPIVVSPDLAVKCTTPSVAELMVDEQRAGPHSNTFVRLYVNAIAKQAVEAGAGPFPTGAIIVKEKLKGDTSAAAVGGMVKRAAGFDPANGDWEYFYAARAGGFASGRLDNCISCHSQAKTRDHVFFSGLMSPAPSGR
jgi:hypothetical protein